MSLGNKYFGPGLTISSTSRFWAACLAEAATVTLGFSIMVLVRVVGMRVVSVTVTYCVRPVFVAA